MRSEGGCFCGAVRYLVSAPPSFVCVCHCRSCQKASGGAMVPWGTFSDAHFKTVKGALEVHESSPGVTRGHCKRCGTSVTYRHIKRAGEVDVTLASLDDPSAFRPTAHIWVEDKLPWIAINDGLPQFQKTVSGEA